MDFYDTVHHLQAGSHLLQSCRQSVKSYVSSNLQDSIYIQVTYILHVLEMSWNKAVTFSHVSGEPVSHFPFTKVENGPKLADITERLVQSHGCGET